MYTLSFIRADYKKSYRQYPIEVVLRLDPLKWISSHNYNEAQISKYKINIKRHQLPGAQLFYGKAYIWGRGQGLQCSEWLGLEKANCGAKCGTASVTASCSCCFRGEGAGKQLLAGDGRKRRPVVELRVAHLGFSGWWLLLHLLRNGKTGEAVPGWWWW